MSERHGNPSATLAERDWDEVLAQLRADGFSPVESMKVTRAVLQLSLRDAKRLVHESPAWADQSEAWDELQDAAVDAADELTR